VNAQEMASPPIAETRAGKRSAVHEFKNENAQEMASPPIAETRAGKRSAVHEFKNEERSF